MIRDGCGAEKVTQNEATVKNHEMIRKWHSNATLIHCNFWVYESFDTIHLLK